MAPSGSNAPILTFTQQPGKTQTPEAAPIILADDSEIVLAALHKCEEGWHLFRAAVTQIQNAANALKNTKESVAGYSIERGLQKHKTHMIEPHLDNLQKFIEAYLAQEEKRKADEKQKAQEQFNVTAKG